MAEAAVAQKSNPLKVIGIIPKKIKDKLNEIADNREMDRIMKEVYDEMGIHNIKDLVKDFQKMVNREEAPHETKPADAYYRSREISDFAERSMKADKRNIKKEYYIAGAAILTFFAKKYAKDAFLWVSAKLAALAAAFSWYVVPVAIVSAYIIINRLCKSKKGNFYDGQQKREDADKALIELVSKLELVQKEIESRRSEFLNAKKTMPKQEYLAWVKQEIKHIIAKAEGVIEMSDLGNLNEITDTSNVTPDKPETPVTSQNPPTIKTTEEPKKEEPMKPEEPTKKSEEVQEGPAL